MKYLIFILLLSCSNEPIGKPEVCNCIIYEWEYITERTYQLISTRIISECLTPITLQEASLNSLENNVKEIKCNE